MSGFLAGAWVLILSLLHSVCGEITCHVALENRLVRPPEKRESEKANSPLVLLGPLLLTTKLLLTLWTPRLPGSTHTVRATGVGNAPEA